ncbi:MAG TPA: hypothetical protein VGG64_03080 [Pirellulales bacterium]|jgi:hypothetical protein
MRFDQRTPAKTARHGAGNILSLGGIAACVVIVGVTGLVVGLFMDLPGAIDQSRRARIEEARATFEQAHEEQAIREREDRTLAQIEPTPLADSAPIVESKPVVEQPQEKPAPPTPTQPAVETPPNPTNVATQSQSSPQTDEVFPDLTSGITLPQSPGKPVTLLSFHAPKTKALSLGLLSNKIVRDGRRFLLKSNGNDWFVEAVDVIKGESQGTAARVAQLDVNASDLRFSWLEPFDSAIANDLRACGLLLEANESLVVAALRPADLHQPLPLDFTRDSMSVPIASGIWDDEGVPLNLEVLNLEGGVGVGLFQTNPSSGRVKLGEPLHVILMQGNPTVALRLTLLQKAGGAILKIEPLIAIGGAKPAPFTKARLERLAVTYRYAGGATLKDSFAQFIDRSTMGFRVFYTTRASEAEIVRYGDRAVRPPGPPF